jgi:hypothetical protein
MIRHAWRVLALTNGNCEQSHMDKRDCLALYPFVVARIPVGFAPVAAHIARTARSEKVGPEMSLRDLMTAFHTIASGGSCTGGRHRRAFLPDQNLFRLKISRLHGTRYSVRLIS